MPLPNSLLSYQDCLDALDKAMSDPIGVRVKVDNWSKAERLRARMHQARALDRKNNQTAYEVGHQMHGASVYDELTVQIKRVGEQHYVYISRTGVRADDVESLAEVTETAVPAIPPGKPEVLEQIINDTVKKRV